MTKARNTQLSVISDLSRLTPCATLAVLRGVVSSEIPSNRYAEGQLFL